MMKFAVLCCVVVAAAARAPVFFAPVPVGYAAPLQQALYNYRGPLSLNPGQPANILAADGRPLDTLAVNLDRSAHFVAKALDNSHVLKKRSVTRLAVAPGPVGFSAAVAAGNVGVAAPFAVGPAGVTTAIATDPIGLSTPFVAGSFGFTGPFAAAPVGLSTPVAANSLVASSTLTAGRVPVSAPVAVGPAGVVATNTPFASIF